TISSSTPATARSKAKPFASPTWATRRKKRLRICLVVWMIVCDENGTVNAERLHALALRIQSELERTQLVQKVEGIAAALHDVIEQGSGPSQQELADSIAAFREAMLKSEVASWSPA